MALLRKLRTRLGLRAEQEKRPKTRNLIAVPGKTKPISGTWYRGEHTNYHPDRTALAEPDAIADYIGKGWLPASPMITHKHYITAFGSCFAREVTTYLYDNGYQVFGRNLSLDTHIVRSGDGIVNSAALLQQFEWAFNGWQPSDEIWHNKDGQAEVASNEIRQATKDIFQNTDVFIFTLGLSEVWYDKITGEIFWRAIPRAQFNPDRHGFRLLSPEENQTNLRRVYDIVRKNRPDAEIIFTLSPIPLAATFRPVSCITANSVSKASLRVAIDSLVRESDDPKLHYFPSYEIATVYFRDELIDDMRHPTRKVVNAIMETFRESYLVA